MTKIDSTISSGNTYARRTTAAHGDFGSVIAAEQRQFAPKKLTLMRGY